VKEKIVMAITIGIICLLLTSVMFVQFKTVHVIEKSGVSLMRESELRAEYTSTKEKADEMEKQIQDIEKNIEEYNNQSSDTQGTLELLRTDIKKSKCDLGYTDVKGPGIIITINDGPDAASDSNQRVSYDNLLFAVNELKYAGAEAISINDQRIVNTTYIKDIQNLYMVMNEQRITSPYIIKVIGDSKYLESVINIKGGLKDELESYNKTVSYTVESEVYINKYNDFIEINYGE
jgi:uncharacterized protein YlxW (UPF0749 family)